MKYGSNPKTAYFQELNGDNRLDLILESNRGSKSIYLQQKNGTYKKLNKPEKSIEKN